MGPGYFPTILSCIIVVIGAIVGLRSLAIEGPPIEPVKLRPLLFILIAILAFGYLIEQIGLAITTAGLAIFAAYARHNVNLKETMLLAVGSVGVRRWRLRLRAGRSRCRSGGEADVDLFANLATGFGAAASVAEHRLRADRLPARHADRRAARHRPDPDHRDAAADHLRARPARRR